ncbi:putative glucokinase 2 [Tritrichomonas foetus]|uniref:Glucokinase 2 n=1 Tax=Tritrichomonas foetus TaxID=1144522 RepID=A0A1J4JNN4_9EUKA|nr:putative glucokinase 2 [Tritrichomonas foetus]|eukprot:OHS99123.1 putative glucokinase 2 [Tritrichomonas foetus]
MIDSQVLSKINSWKVGNNLNFCLGADVGGSGIRFCLTNANDQNDKIEPGHIKVKSAQEFMNAFDNLHQAIQSVAKGAKCVGSSIACAGLRKEDTVQVMNWNGPAENQTIRISKINQNLFPKSHSLVLNDLEAGAYGVIALGESGKANEYFQKLWGPKGGSLLSKYYHTAVMAMGSGLGSALIIKEPETHANVVMPTESGYLMSSSRGMEHPNYNKEIGTLEFISDRYFDGQLNPPYEDLASGHGIVDDYDALIHGKSGLDAGQIAEMAKKGDLNAKTAMKNHYIFFTRLAKQLAYGTNCRSIVMALSNQVANKWLIDEILPELEAEFKDATAWRWIREVSVYSQVKECNVNMVGTTYVAHYCANHKI